MPRWDSTKKAMGQSSERGLHHPNIRIFVSGRKAEESMRYSVWSRECEARNKASCGGGSPGVMV